MPRRRNTASTSAITRRPTAGHDRLHVAPLPRLGDPLPPAHCRIHTAVTFARRDAQAAVIAPQTGGSSRGPALSGFAPSTAFLAFWSRRKRVAARQPAPNPPRALRRPSRRRSAFPVSGPDPSNFQVHAARSHGAAHSLGAGRNLLPFRPVLRCVESRGSSGTRPSPDGELPLLLGMPGQARPQEHCIQCRPRSPGAGQGVAKAAKVAKGSGEPSRA